MSERSFSVDGGTRSYRLFVPHEIPKQAPLVIVLHGSGGTPVQYEGATGYDDVAARGAFLVAYAAGINKNWNAGQALTFGANSDDVKFLVALVDDVARAHAVDRRRVFLTGHSAGGWMAYRAGCERADVFAAVVAVGTTLMQVCRPSRSLPVLQVHGMADTVLGMNVARDAIDQMRKVDRCPAAAVVKREPKVTVTTYSPCGQGSEVIWVTIEGVGHVWPIASQGYSATARGWEFFSRHPLPAS